MDLQALETSAPQVAARSRRRRAEAPGARSPAQDYGAHPEHYAVVGSVLIDSMAEVAGPAWRPEYTRAWSEALDVVAGTMLEGARV